MIGVMTCYSFEDAPPHFDFIEYDEDMPVINFKRRRKLSPMEMDMMTNEEIEDWYERNGRYGYND